MHADVWVVLAIGLMVIIGLAIFGKLVIKSIKFAIYGVIIVGVGVYALVRSH